MSYNVGAERFAWIFSWHVRYCLTVNGHVLPISAQYSTEY